MSKTPSAFVCSVWLAGCSLLVDPDRSLIDGGRPNAQNDDAGEREGPMVRCPAHQATCEGSCVSLETDDRHCGACGTSCALGDECIGGVCACVGDGCAGGDGCSGSCDDDEICVDDECRDYGFGCDDCNGHHERCCPFNGGMICVDSRHCP